MKTKDCKYCGGSDHTSLMCFKKPRRRIRPVSEKKLHKKQEVDRLWYELNPPDEHGVWYCYLNISPICPYKLTRSTINLEHVKSKARYPELRYEVTNLKPACTHCNKIKGSRDIDEL